MLTVRHEDDPAAGRLLEKAKLTLTPTSGPVITLPAVAEEPVAAHDPAGRAEVLWPMRWDAAEMRRKVLSW